MMDRGHVSSENQQHVQCSLLEQIKLDLKDSKKLTLYFIRLPLRIVSVAQ